MVEGKRKYCVILKNCTHVRKHGKKEQRNQRDKKVLSAYNYN